MISIGLSKKGPKKLKKDNYVYNQEQINHMIYNDLKMDLDKVDQEKNK